VDEVSIEGATRHLNIESTWNDTAMYISAAVCCQWTAVM
jgi:hypothetical protein